ncbi:hypothetical protein GCM10029992_07530 [Glycomyces albus]
MVRTRQAKIDGISVPNLEVDDPDRSRTLVVGWGSTYGPIRAAVRRLRSRGHAIAQAHLRHLSPFPPNLDEVLASFDRVVVPEMNLGQLALLLRARAQNRIVSHTKVTGLPFKAGELETVLIDLMEGAAA